MGAALRAELFKALRRPGVWVTLGLMFVVLLGLNYLTIWLVATHLPAVRGPGGGERLAAIANARKGLYPSAFVRKTLSAGQGLMGVFILIVAVLLQGSEYGWGTVKTAFTQLPGRIEIMAGRLLTLAVLIVLAGAGLLAAGAAISYALALADGVAVSWPSVTEIGKGLAALWLISGVWAAIGFALATLFRQSGAAIGVGLAYGILVEDLVFSLLSGLGDTVKQVHIWFPVANMGYLVQSFGQATGGIGPAGLATTPDADATHAVIVLLLWLAVLVAGSLFLVKRRDVI